MMGIVVPETCWAYKKYNKIISGMYLVFIFQLSQWCTVQQTSNTCKISSLQSLLLSYIPQAVSINTGILSDTKYVSTIKRYNANPNTWPSIFCIWIRWQCKLVRQILLLYSWSKRREKQWNQFLENRMQCQQNQIQWHLKEAFCPTSFCDAVCSPARRWWGTQFHCITKSRVLSNIRIH